MLPREIIKKIRRIEIKTSHIVDEILGRGGDSANANDNTGAGTGRAGGWAEDDSDLAGLE